MQTKKTHNLMIFGGILALLAITAVIVLSGVRGGWFKGSLTLPSIPLYYVDINTPAKLNNPDYAQYADGTKSMPFITIKAAVDKLKTEGTSNAIIMVAKGTYNENVNLENFNGIYLLGGYSSTFTSQNTETNETIVNGVMNGTNIGGEISGFTYKNYGSSTSPKIRAIYISNMITPKTITVSNNRFRNSVVNGNFIGIKSMSGGKGIIKDNSFSTVHSVKALIDSVDSAGETIIEKNLIYASRSDETLIKGNAGSIIKNNLISRTGFGNKNSIYGNNAKIINNTIYMDENSTNCIEVIGTSQVNNNLIVICSGKAVQQASTSNVIYNGVWPNDANVGNMNMLRNLKCDPKFTGTTLTSNPVGYKLGATSECIDKGFIDPLVTHDYFGTTRPQGQAHDLGFYEALYVPVCGDGKKEGSEACDDGNILAGDGCSPTCTIESGWTCTGSPSVCTQIPPTTDLCTNIAGVQTTVPTGYTREGTICIKCGDGIKEGSEACDDGNILAGDGCSPTCTIESGWTCTGSPSVCTQIPPTTDLCTNIAGVQTTVPTGYKLEGTICIKCGDGKKEGSEKCDDGNILAGDGCSPTCTIESGWTCTGSPSVCTQIPPTTDLCTNIAGVQTTVPTGYTREGTICIKCGDGIKEGSEKCDDGNILTGDGCSPTCTVESGWTCTLVNQRSVCTRIPTTTDLCTNLPGIQTSIPAGYVREGTICTPVTTPPTPTQEAECGEWTDISKSDPEYGIWVWQCQRNILRGYPDGTLKPENKLNRAELLALAFRASTYEGTGDVNLNLKNCFNDGRGEWYEPYMCTGKDRGFIVGYPGNVFRGENTVILAEGLKMFLGALAKSYSTASEPWFYNMLWDSHLKQLLPYSLRDQNDIVPVGTTELTRRRAVNMLYRIQIMAK